MKWNSGGYRDQLYAREKHVNEVTKWVVTYINRLFFTVYSHCLEDSPFQSIVDLYSVKKGLACLLMVPGIHLVPVGQN